MDLPNILNNRGGSGMALANQQHLQHYADLSGRAMSDTGSERGMSPHLSDRGQHMRAGQQQLQALSMDHLPQQHYHHHQFSMGSNPYPTPTGSIENGYGQTPDEQQLQTPVSDGGVQPKAFACRTCAKGFARRSDLARHGEYLILTSYSS